MEQGQIAEAMATYRIAADITPGCVLRLQHCGTLAFYAGDAASATQMLERTWATGSKSRLFDVLSMLLLAFLRFDARDGAGLARACEVLRRFAADHPESVRLRRLASLGATLTDLYDAKVVEGVALARESAAEATHPGFDMEAAANTLSLWSRIDHSGVDEAEFLQSRGNRTALLRVARVDRSAGRGGAAASGGGRGWCAPAHTEATTSPRRDDPRRARPAATGVKSLRTMPRRPATPS